MATPTLTTARLRLTPLDPQQDREGYFHLVADPEVGRYIDLDPFTAIEQADAVLATIAQRVSTGVFFHWAVRLLEREGDELVGSVNLKCDFERRRAETGYYFASAVWGKGYGKEAVRAVLAFGFGDLGLNRIEALTCTENVASQALLRSLGFQEEGHLREHAWEKGRYCDDLIFGLLRREWEAQLA